MPSALGAGQATPAGPGDPPVVPAPSPFSLSPPRRGSPPRAAPPVGAAGGRGAVRGGAGRGRALSPAAAARSGEGPAPAAAERRRGDAGGGGLSPAEPRERRWRSAPGSSCPRCSGPGGRGRRCAAGAPPRGRTEGSAERRRRTRRRRASRRASGKYGDGRARRGPAACGAAPCMGRPPLPAPPSPARRSPPRIAFGSSAALPPGGLLAEPAGCPRLLGNGELCSPGEGAGERRAPRPAPQIRCAAAPRALGEDAASLEVSGGCSESSG